MRKMRFTEEQIIGVLKENQVRVAVAELLGSTGSATRRSTIGDPLRWDGGLGRQKVEGAGKENRKLKAAGGIGVGCGDAEGGVGKKLLTPGRGDKP